MITMLAINLVLHVHFPQETTDFRIKSVGTGQPWLDASLNGARFREWARGCYWPLARTLAASLRRHRGLKVNLSLSQSFLENCETFDPVLLEYWQDLVGLPQCELLAEPRGHGLAFLLGEAEFEAQLVDHVRTLRRLFARQPAVAHNSGLIYSDFVGRVVARAGFRGCLFEGWEPVLPGKFSAAHLFHHGEIPSLALIPSHPSFTEDLQRLMATSPSRPLPLTPERFQAWFVKESRRESEVVSLFLDVTPAAGHFRPFQGFLEEWLPLLAEDPSCFTMNVSDVLARFGSSGPVRIPEPVSQSLEGHDVSPWLGNTLQQDLLERLNELAPLVLESEDPGLISDWRSLHSLDLFAQLRVRFLESDDDDSHSTRTSAYDVYLRVMNMLEDLSLRLGSRNGALRDSAALPRAGVSGLLESLGSCQVRC